MQNLKYIIILIFILSACRHKKDGCIPEIKEYLFHKNSSVCMFRQGDTVTDRFIKYRILYDSLKYHQRLHSCFLIDGYNTVFEYNYYAKQCYSEVYWEYFLFQIPSYIDEFKVQDNNLKFLHCVLDRTCQMCMCSDWNFKKGLIYGNRINDSIWFVSADIKGYCEDSLTNDSISIKFKANFNYHKGQCINYINKK